MLFHQDFLDTNIHRTPFFFSNSKDEFQARWPNDLAPSAGQVIRCASQVGVTPDKGDTAVLPSMTSRMAGSRQLAGDLGSREDPRLRTQSGVVPKCMSAQTKTGRRQKQSWVQYLRRQLSFTRGRRAPTTTPNSLVHGGPAAHANSTPEPLLHRIPISVKCLNMEPLSPPA